jgi:DUF2075 family protein
MRREPEATTILVDRIIRNTYRTLMTRGMKGCFVHCVDPETQDYFRRRLGGDEPNHRSEQGILI